MSSNTWNEIYELVGRIQFRALKSENWETAKDAHRITALLHHLSEEISSENSEAAPKG